MTLDRAFSRDITVVANTNGLTAAGGADFADIVQQTLTIPAGAVSTTVTVDVTGDHTVELDETFEVNLSDVQFDGNLNPPVLRISDGQGIGTITNDDVASRPDR